jgi:hypothetical protein
MAIKAPTAPTPPTPPVSPKGQNSGDAGHNNENTGAEAPGKDFGIHINISSPEDKTGKNQTQNQQQNTNTSGDGKVQKEVTIKERDQLPEPQAVLTGDMPSDKLLQTETKDPGNDALHLNNNSSFGGISIWPFVLVFVTAFIGFTVLNYLKKKEHETVTPINIKKDNKVTDKAEGSQRDFHSVNIGKSSANNKDDDTHKHFEIRI